MLEGDNIRHYSAWQDAEQHLTLQPETFSLSVYPNPFNPSATISFTLPRAGVVKMGVYDVLGREVVSRYAGAHIGTPLQAGEHHITFDGAGLASGIYFVKMEAGEHDEDEEDHAPQIKPQTSNFKLERGGQKWSPLFVSCCWQQIRICFREKYYFFPTRSLRPIQYYGHDILAKFAVGSALSQIIEAGLL